LIKNKNFTQDKIKIKELYFATGQHIGGDCFRLGMVTLNEQIFYSFVYAKPVISDEKANLFANYVMQIIHNFSTDEFFSLENIQ
jgi:hypothetical protein